MAINLTLLTIRRGQSMMFPAKGMHGFKGRKIGDESLATRSRFRLLNNTHSEIFADVFAMTVTIPP